MKLSDLDKDIGTAKDNKLSPIHDWYRFTAGFSYKLVDRIIKEEKLSEKDVLYESFAGCGTTLVSAQKNGITAIGNESQELLYDIIQAKLNWDISADDVFMILRELRHYLKESNHTNNFHDLLLSLYSETDLYFLYLIRDFIASYVTDKRTALFLKLALTQTLHKVSIHPIAVPYISRSKLLSSSLSAHETFERTVLKMLYDLEEVFNSNSTSKIFLHDSRKQNEAIPNNYASICITSPPYLNNLDYGEVSKVCSHFYGITDNWNDITVKVRKKLVTGSTTHYKESDFDFNAWKTGEFYYQNKQIADELIPKVEQIKQISKSKKGKKSFDILTLFYFEDMFKVLNEMNRILKKNSKAYLVLGDSAPYGVYINTTKILGQISQNCGFSNFKIIKIRERGTKWTSLKHRHSLKLSENVLILKK